MYGKAGTAAGAGMVASPLFEAYLRQLIPAESVALLLSPKSSFSERAQTMEALLRSEAGQRLRNELGTWIVRLLRVDYLVPQSYAKWRPLVADCMLFMSSHLSDARLAPKLVEQMDLPADTPAEVRLLRLIAKVPGLQKLGQVLARNRHLVAPLRRALSELENGISDVEIAQIRTIIVEELGPRLEACKVEIAPVIFCEASVSAVVRFTWWNPKLRARERGVFKVMKPYVAACYAEDMRLLGELASFLGSKHHEYQVAARGISDTFREVRQLLEHEVHFLREQTTLVRAARLYASVPGVRVPRVIPPLCTSKITAMTEEAGKKVPDAVVRMTARDRRRVAEQLIEALIAVPLSAPGGAVLFHADPHAGNLLYNRKTGELVLLDWALAERLTLAQRRHLALLFLMVSLRDAVGVCREINALMRNSVHNRRQHKIIRGCVDEFLDDLPLTTLPNSVDAMALLERIAYEGVHFPAALIMLRKMTFTLDGILHDVAGRNASMEFVIARRILRDWTAKFENFGAPLSWRDWLLVQCSLFLCGGRLWVQWAERKLARIGSGREAAPRMQPARSTV